jgi:NAD(P)H-hydrate epimerase
MSAFVTDTGIPVPDLSVAQMRQLDRLAVEQATPNLFQMMENAGRDLADATIRFLGREWPDVPITVFAGTGGNGGGGIAGARHLANRGGNITLVLGKKPDPETIVGQQLEVYQQTRCRLVESWNIESGLIIDALIGYGLTDAPHGLTAEMITAINEVNTPVISLDIPSGLDGDSGEPPGVAVIPAQTITLALPKTGLGSDDSGDIWLGDLGIPVEVFRQLDVEPSPRIFEQSPLVHLNRKTP